jgi:hypothetical protein
MSSEQTLKKSYRLDANVELGKFTVVIQESTNYADGCAVPGGANAAGILGVAQNSVIPTGTADYSGGQYNITSGTAWPTNSIPTQGQGEEVQVMRAGISRCVASGAISRGDAVNVADNQGRIKTVNEAGGTLVHVLGFAEDAASVAGDVIRVLVNVHDRHT